MSVERLPADQADLVEAIALRVVELLDERPARWGLLTAAELADELGVARSFIYEHAEELGATRLGAGSKPRLRFDAARARAGLACYASKGSQAPTASDSGQIAEPAAHRRRRLPSGLPKPGSVLAVRGRGGTIA